MEVKKREMIEEEVEEEEEEEEQEQDQEEEKEGEEEEEVDAGVDEDHHHHRHRYRCCCGSHHQWAVLAVSTKTPCPRRQQPERSAFYVDSGILLFCFVGMSPVEVGSFYSSADDLVDSHKTLLFVHPFWRRSRGGIGNRNAICDHHVDNTVL